jgi:predicted kinase
MLAQKAPQPGYKRITQQTADATIKAIIQYGTLRQALLDADCQILASAGTERETWTDIKRAIVERMELTRQLIGFTLGVQFTDVQRIP